jgi:hypothetical protein
MHYISGSSIMRTELLGWSETKHVVKKSNRVWKIQNVPERRAMVTTEQKQVSMRD